MSTGLTMADFSDEDEAAPGPEIAARQLRILEALLFASADPLSEAEVRPYLGDEANLSALFLTLQAEYSERGVNLVRRGQKWAFRTAEDLALLLQREEVAHKAMSRAAMETLAIIAYHQPATRAEIEEVRGVTTGQGSFDKLLEAGWIRMRGRRRTPGRPITFGTTDTFLDHFGLEGLGDLPGLEDLKGTGLLSGKLPPNLQVPMPFDGPLQDDEDPLEDGSEDESDVG